MRSKSTALQNDTVWPHVVTLLDWQTEPQAASRVTGVKRAALLAKSGEGVADASERIAFTNYDSKNKHKIFLDRGPLAVGPGFNARPVQIMSLLTPRQCSQ